ncbi:MAG TPA: hypothetical protein DHV28_07645 [Ignavibacteriales bacterium]|nr:hypothetical protein [Ignavibacteriales bacterium]
MNRKITNKLIAFSIGIILPIVIILLWNWGVKTEVLPPSLIASPIKVLSKFKTLIGDDVLWLNAKASLFRLLAGFLLGSIFGIALGVLVGVSKLASRIIEPLFLILIPVPPLAWIPLLIITFGIDQGSKIALISIGSFCTLFLTTSYSVKATDKNLLELSNLYSKEWYVKLFRILLPSSASNIIGSLRVSMALSWTLLMASEMIASSSGLGWFIWDSRNFSRPDDMIVGMISVGILGWFTDRSLQWLGNYFSRWKAVKKEPSLLNMFRIWVWSNLPLQNQWNDLRAIYRKLQLSVSDFFFDKFNLVFGKKKSQSRTHPDTSNKTVLEVSIKEKKFKLNGGELRVLKNLSLNIQQGEFNTFIGPSGCGKTTLLKLIAGLDVDFSGEIRNSNEKVIGSSLERCIVFQEQRLLPWLRVKDNITFSLPVSIRGNLKRKKALEAIELVGLTGFENAYPNQLSGGMQQRVALARAMVNLPRVLLLDEPFGALDSITRDKMQKEMKRILKGTDTTVLMVTHDIDEAITLSDRILVLNGSPTSISNSFNINRNGAHDKTTDEFVKIRKELINELFR